MFSLLPVLLLIAFQGPSALEGLGHGDRLPEALRAWERVFAAAKSSGDINGQNDEGRNLEKASEALARWASLSSDAALSVAIAHFLNLDAPEVSVPGRENPAQFEPSQAPATTAEGGPAAGTHGERYLHCRRNRAGPVQR